MSNVPLLTLEKPPHGDRCNNCGACCQDQLCPLGFKLFGRWRGPCPALQRGAAGALTCGVVTSPRDYHPAACDAMSEAAVSRAAAVLIGAGAGCDALMVGEKVNVAFRAALRAKPMSIEAMVARKIWGFE